MTKRSFVLALALCALWQFVVAANAWENDSTKLDGWRQWRGPKRDGQVSGVAWGEKLDGEHLQVLWRKEMGPSYSGPLVVGDRVFVTETRDKREEVVRALDRATGEQVWESGWEGSMTVPFFAKSNGDWIRATPAYDGGKLFVAGMRDVLVCLNADDGKQLWRVDFVKETGSSLPAFGFVSSPLVIGDHVYVQAGGGFTKLDKGTGKIVWQTLKDGGGMNGSAFSSPVLASIAGKEQLVVQTRESLCGVETESGNVLWKHEVPAFRGMNILTPTVIGDTIFTSTYGGKTLLLKVVATGDRYAVNEVWSNKAQGYMSSPVVLDGFIYLHLRNQRFTCIDLKTGETKWTSDAYGKYWSLVAQGDRMLALDERGELLSIRATPEKFDLISSRKIADAETWAHLAIDLDQIFVRELKALTVFRWNK